MSDEEFLLEVGDKIVCDSGLGRHTYTISRVTKTTAFAALNNGTNYEAKFRRKVGWYGVRPKPLPEWDSTRRTVIRAKPTLAQPTSGE